MKIEQKDPGESDLLVMTITNSNYEYWFPDDFNCNVLPSNAWLDLITLEKLT